MLVIADRAFRTKGELQDYLRHLRESHALGQVVIPEHYALLHALLLDQGFA